ncbi:MAG: TonB-dependent receptor, partial [Candidatus Marinimicrobia bacterium]|nr:TonB-dependent receptor [Candidatus Neomarinimicrobiota bacterium]
QWDYGEEILGDYGRDGLPNTGDPGENDGILIAMDGFQGEVWNDDNADGKIDPSEFIDLNGNGRYDYPSGEFDSIFDTGDGVFGFEGEAYTDSNGNGIYDNGEPYTDSNGDMQYTPPDYVDNFQHVSDVNGDGLSDFPDFEVDNRKVELRLDYDPSRNFNLTFQSGYSWTKTQQVTGTGRYLADGFEYTYYQLRGRFYNWYSQFYMNQSNSGNTRSYNLGSVVDDKSKNYAYQLQRSDDYHNLNTQLVWGLDYFKTLPSTNGTILNDGPNGYDNDGDNVWIGYDGIDQDGDGQPDDPFCPDSTKSGRRNGRQWNCYEGVDEEDEFDDPESNEYGFYYQSKTELFGTSRYELITAARWDFHDLLDEGIQFAPKLGFIYKPDEKSSFRFTYGKAFNTPNSITLYTDLFVRKQGIMDVYLRGNKNGTPYCRVGEACASGGQVGNGSVTGSIPGYYKHDGTFQSISSLSGDYFTGNSSTKPYDERVQGAPYFYNLSDAAPIDMIPLDTSRYLIYIPELSGDGVLYTPEESVSIPNVDPIGTEKIQTVEFGFKGFLGRRTHVTLDYYLSFYEDFFSPPTFITPSVVLRSSVSDGNTDDMRIVGIMPVNSFETNAPYGTAWNGKDDDGDWDYWRNTNYEQLSPTNGSHWDDDDKNGDGNTADPGEWGLVYWHTAANSIKDTLGYYFFEPADIIASDDGGITFQENVSAVTPEGETIDVNLTHTQAVGIDEYHPTVGLNEAELVPTGLFGEDGEQLLGPGLAYSPPHLVLSPMNYGEVWMQGLDVGMTHLLPEYNLVIDGNLSWYGTTEFYNELTKKNDPINAPQWKWNASIKWDSPIGGLTLNYRHVDEFTWNDGIWSGVIGPYDIFDIHYNLELTSNLEMSVSALNILDDRHKELIGGAVMGRQVIMRMTSSF